MLSILPPIYALCQIERAANLAVPMKLYVNIRRIMPYNKDDEYSYMWTRAQTIIWCEHVGGLTY